MPLRFSYFILSRNFFLVSDQFLLEVECSSHFIEEKNEFSLNEAKVYRNVKCINEIDLSREIEKGELVDWLSGVEGEEVSISPV